MPGGKLREKDKGCRFAVKSALFSFSFFLGFLTSGGQNPPAKAPVPPAASTQQSRIQVQTHSQNRRIAVNKIPFPRNRHSKFNAGQGPAGTSLSLGRNPTPCPGICIPTGGN
jgi:hypothetical protein